MQNEPKCDFKVGDLVHEKHYPDRMGVIIRIINVGSKHSTKLSVQWQNHNPNQWKPGTPEIIDSFYVIRVDEETSDEDRKSC